MMLKSKNPADIPDLKTVRDQIEKMRAEGRHDEAVETLFTLIESILRDLADKNARLSGLLKRLYGRRSEKVDPNQLDLFFQVLSECEAAAAPVEKEEPAVSEQELPKPKPRATPHGRKPLPADLPREKVEILPAESEQRCETCNSEKVVIGHEVSEVIEYVPASFLVKEIRRAKMACPKCEEGVVVAPVADKVIEKGRPGPGLLAHTLTLKYAEHLPLTRIAEVFRRDGLDLGTSTLSDWVGAGANALVSIYEAMVRRVMACYLVGTDDTGLRVLDRDHENGVRRGSIWCYLGDQRLVVFDYTPDRKSEGPARFLKKEHGVVQCDGYSGYKRIAREHPNVVWAGCMAHARRKFVEALDAGDARAAIPVQIIRRLYEVEEKAKEDSPEMRRVRRQAESVPAMDRLRAWMKEMLLKVPPKTPLGRAITYTIKQWPSLCVYLNDGKVPIDNNGVERQIRRIAVGRKNWLFAGSDAGARRAAILYSIIGTCSLWNVNPEEYLRDILDRISRGWPSSRIEELLPDVWAETHTPTGTGPP